MRKLLVVSGVAFSILILTGAVTQPNWFTQIKGIPVMDARTYGVKCDNNSSTDDGPALQAAIDAVPTANGSSPTPMVIQLPAGNCYINTVVLLRRGGVVLKGFGPQQANMCTNSNCSTAAYVSGTTLIAKSTFDGPFIRADAGDVTVPAVSPVLRGVAIQDMAFDSTAAVGGGHFAGHFQVETGSLSQPAVFSGLSFRGHVAGGIKFAASLTSTSTYSINPYVPEGIILRDFYSISAASPTAPAVLLKGVNQTEVANGRIFCPNLPTPSGTTADVSAVQVSSDNYALSSEGVVLDNLTGGNYPVWIRISGADQNKVPCSTPPSSGGCGTSPYHSSPVSVNITNNSVEPANRTLVINDESNGSGGTRFPSYDINWNRTNKIIQAYGSSQKLADVDWLFGGEISAGYYERLFPIILGSNTNNVLSVVPYDSGTNIGIQVTSGGGNRTVVSQNITSFGQLPSSAPVGCQMVCVDCSCASGSTCTGSGTYRAIAWNGSSWVGQ